VSNGEEEKLRALGSPAQIPLARGDQQGMLILIAPATAQWSVRKEAYAAATKGNVRLPVRTLGHETRL